MFDEAMLFFRRLYWRIRAYLGFSPSPSDEEIDEALRKALSKPLEEGLESLSSKVCLVTFDDGRPDVCTSKIHDKIRCDIFRVEIGGSGCSIVDGPCSTDSRVR